MVAMQLEQWCRGHTIYRYSRIPIATHTHVGGIVYLQDSSSIRLNKSKTLLDSVIPCLVVDISMGWIFIGKEIPVAGNN